MLQQPCDSGQCPRNTTVRIQGSGLLVRGVHPALSPHAEIKKIRKSGHSPMQATPIYFVTTREASISRFGWRPGWSVEAIL